MLCSWFFLSVFPCRAAGSSGRFRSAARCWRDERNWTEFLFAPFSPPPAVPLSPPPPPPPAAAADRSLLLPLSCLRLLMTKVCCLCEGKAGGLDLFTRSPGGPGRVNHVILLPRPSFSPTLRRRGNGAEGGVCVVSMVPKWSLSGECVACASASRSILGEMPFFSEE